MEGVNVGQIFLRSRFRRSRAARTVLFRGAEEQSFIVRESVRLA